MKSSGRLQRALNLTLLFTPIAYAAEAPPAIGNFALPGSQQPGPLVSLGQDIISKNETQLSVFADDYLGTNKHFIDAIPGILYGITDQLSVLINVPVAVSYETGPQHSAGLEDAYLQLEYAPYSVSTAKYTQQATLVANITVPTGSSSKNPNTGIGAPSFLLGTTINRNYVDWFGFASPGVILTTSRKNTQFGNSYLYQMGIGRNITEGHGWILAWLLEADGTYTETNKIQGSYDPNSGGHVLTLTPSLWASTKTFLCQFGVGFPVTQHLYGNQTPETALLVANIGWSIY